MRLYSYDPNDNSFDEYDGELSGTSSEFHRHPDRSFGLEEIYYKTEGQTITEIICEAPNEVTARKAVKEFLSTLG